MPIENPEAKNEVDPTKSICCSMSYWPVNVLSSLAFSGILTYLRCCCAPIVNVDARKTMVTNLSSY